MPGKRIAMRKIRDVLRLRLSADGSSLTGLDVGGVLYDVMFGDGVVGDVYADVVFDADREIEARVLSDAIVAALNTIGGVSITDLKGCESLRECQAWIPSEELGDFFFGDVAELDSNSGGVWSGTVGATIPILLRDEDTVTFDLVQHFFTTQLSGIFQFNHFRLILDRADITQI